ncbi:hypothetical protein QYF50_12455 [Paenibacillus vini]|uniref:hypothetical protein n=1 Tax=Paenibacillus vini TaxID=1476024 RepID=UPI0025B6AA5C|nr:hypothetical protein [Paenibacillus vini]MDN4068706.1 hypothetical protein [Paenibacillus vini]
MRKSIKVFIIVCLLGILIPIKPTYSSDIEIPKTVEAVIDKINQDMEKLYRKGNDYYPSYITKDGANLYLRKDLIQKRLDRVKEGDIKKNPNGFTFEMVYGTDHGADLNHNGTKMKEYSGYSKDGHHVSTEGVPWFAGWSGTQIQNFDMIPTPWINSRVIGKYGIATTPFDDYKDTERINKYLLDGTLEQSIIDGLTFVYGGDHRYKEFMYNNQNATLKDERVYVDGAKPSKGGNWTHYVHVLQPPTEYSWGLGTIYIDSSIGITYLDIPLAPFILQTTDISAKFDSLPKEALAGERIKVAVSVASNFPEPVNPEFEWNITSGGNKLTPQDNGLSFSGHASSQSGNIKLVKNESRVLIAEFTMPRSDVTIQFKVNKDGKDPEEIILGNNVLNSSPKAVQVIVPKGLQYDILSVKDKFSLKNNPLVATLKLPRSDASWTSPATGKLNVNNDTPNLFREHKVTNNPDVNEWSESISRSPVFEATIHRKDFGDDPENKKWKKPAPEPKDPLRRDGTVSYSGSVSADYKYTVQNCTKNEKGEEECTPETKTGTESANFEVPGTDRKAYDVYVYNGLKEIPKQTFQNKINYSNADKTFKKDMYWENEPYNYDVIRWMYHLDENGKPYAPNGIKPDANDNGIAVPGQYQRVFTQQASANIAWKSEKTMAQEYATARKAAKDKKNNKKLYDKAVFPTDRDLQKYAYPIKSGYYFNPAGSYTFNVKTVTYKQSDADTKDHEDLVNTLIDSFRYETNLIYINNKKTAVNIANDPLDPKGGGFKTVPGILSAKNPKGVNGEVLLEVLDRSDKNEQRYHKEVEEIESSMQKTGTTHEFWKMVMEGYTDSSTLGSNTYYNYREFVKDGQKKMYKITETTKVTIQINPKNTPIYTHANMQNGKYYVKAWVADTALSRGDHTYSKLGTLQGVDLLDNIEVTVIGSMFDDLNN